MCNFACCFYGCETWSHKLRKVCGPRVFENRVLRRTFEPNSDGVTGEWRKLHNELNDLYCSQNIVRVIKSRRMGWKGNVARKDYRRGLYEGFLGNSEGKRPLGNTRPKCHNDFKMHLQEV